MCVIIHQPKGAYLTKEEAQEAWRQNPDGGGFAYLRNDGEMAVEKFMEFPSFWRAFETARSAYPKRDYLIHFRIGTHGSKDLFNVHPFEVDEGLTVMAHNGIIHGVPDYHDGRSDTRVFVDEVLPGLPPGWLDNGYIVDMLEDWLGWSKLMFLTNDPALKENVYIVNRSAGKDHNGMWWSNDSWSKPYKHTYPGNQKAVTYRSSSEDEYMSSQTWWEERNAARIAEAETGTKVVKPGSTDDQEDLQDLRSDSWLLQEIWWDPIENVWECFGCNVAVDSETGECGCWDKICMDCAHYAGECTCPEGFSMRLIDGKDAPAELKLTAQQQTWVPAEEGEHETVSR